ncbi:hypothetical protein CONPUDRAFT_138922 [Coniophora puteana RWD-64-598 SS2]|uniref:Uncharacterized protein n=1 Tax=Coniophora puteana (strain RWD-64-598) TaxID=741705 RepID=A0A5M3MFF9_CONPW|nr:uncharacterized protein CONPUDRAFT_138922 [Coniophora puteana RWD-64-598 SS2]EIW77660.1 hypothetical protein CONPUDRAFT_138922 [Coniophora puteana RWD-64-598 SS2]
MVVFNTTVSSLSPLLLFVPQALWSLSDNTSTNATSNTAVVSNSSQGRAMALLQFTGTGVWIYGNSSSTSLDNCVVVVDGKRDSCISELDPGDTTSMLLYNGISLSPGKHIIELVNLENPEGNIVALDHAKFESNISGANVSQTQVQATTLGGSYHGVWSNATQGSIANSPTSSMSYNFTGAAIF